MTNNNTLVDNNIKGFDEPSKYVPGNHKEYLTGFESITSCYDRICIECTNDHSFRGNFEDATTLIDLLPELFPEIFKNNRSSSIGINKLQEFVN